MKGNSALVRLKKDTYGLLHELAEQEGVSMQELVARALENYRRDCFFAQARAAYAALESNPGAWAEYRQEQAELDGTLMDGLDEHEYARDDSA